MTRNGKVVATIEARMGSSRLPGKVLKPLAGKPALERLIERLRHSRALDDIVVATTVSPADEEIEALCHSTATQCFRGSEDDVLDRVLRAAKSVDADYIVEITADCPLIDPDVVDRTVDYFFAHDYDYVYNRGKVEPYPDGLDTQVFPTAILSEVAERTQDPADREHVSLHIYTHPERYRCGFMPSGLPQEHQDLRLTLDTPEDLRLISGIFEALYPKNPRFSIGDVLAFLDANPELRAANREIRPKPVG